MSRLRPKTKTALFAGGSPSRSDQIGADLAMYRRIRGAANGATPVGLARSLSFAGEHAGVWVALGAGAIGVDPDERRRWIRGLTRVVAAHGACAVRKRVIRRRRPAESDLPPLVTTASSLSFPSAHAASSFAAVQAYGRLMPAIPLMTLTVAITGSRVFLGAHYPSDAIAGAALGAAMGRSFRD
jgi:membrane-associated phospholipid phosphatase